MAELAFNINGERFDLPASASCWRVRRFKASGRGTPEVVFGHDGLPLIIPIDTEIAEFRTLVRNVPGRYRLDAVDEHQKTCEDGTGAYVQLSDEVTASSSNAAASQHSEGDELLREIVRANSDMVKVIAEKFATVMDSAATLLRAADGAGMPSREAAVIPLQLASAWRNAEQPDSRHKGDEDDDYDGDDESSGTMHLARVIENVASQAMPLVKHHIHTKFMGLSPEQSIAMMGGVGAAPSASTASSSASAPTDTHTTPRDEQRADAAPAPAPSPDFFMHLAAIEQRLTPAEAQLARRAIKQMAPDAMAAWKEQIMRMSPDQAAELVRAECARIADNESTATQGTANTNSTDSADNTETTKDAA